jgi:hypothetical protein
MSRDVVLLRGVCRVCSGLMRHSNSVAGLIKLTGFKLVSDTLDSVLLLGVGS